MVKCLETRKNQWLDQVSTLFVILVLDLISHIVHLPVCQLGIGRNKFRNVFVSLPYSLRCHIPIFSVFIIAITCDKPTVMNGMLTSVHSLSQTIMVAEEARRFIKRSKGKRSLEPIHYLPGTNVRLICNFGYRISGSNSSVCLSNGHWSSPIGSCIRATCPLPHQPDNGQMVRTAEPSRAFFEPIKGESLRFQCDHDYRLIGVPEIRCLESGQWSDAPPVCELVKCATPPKVENGFVAANGNYQVGTSVMVTCNSGYKINGSPIVTCQGDGFWGDFPSCVNIFCSVPPPIDNGRVLYDSNMGGGKAQYRCNKGYRLVGPSTLTCQSSGSWSPAERPQCEEVTCPQPPLISNANILMQSEPAKATSTATYVCADGFQIEGPSTIMCMENGQWTAKLPYCKGKQAYLKL